MIRLALPLLLLAFTGCTALREHAAKDRYLGQMLYDYVYERPIDEVWREAMAVVGRAPSSGLEMVEGPHHAAGREWEGTILLHPQSSTGMRVRVVAEALDERRTRVAILRAAPDGPEGRQLGPRDLDGRLWDLELRVLEALEPEDARRIENGSLRAARRARAP